MLGQDSDAVRRFIAYATAQRNAQLLATPALDLRVLSIATSDNRQFQLVWTTGLIDKNGNPIPDDWVAQII